MRRAYLILPALLIGSAAAHAQVANQKAGTSRDVASKPERASRKPSPRRDQWRLYLTSGAFYSSGDYGRDGRTRSLVAPFLVSARKGPLRISASLPWLRISGPGTIIGTGEDGVIIDDLDPQAQQVVRSGIGDASVRVRYRIEPKSWKGVELDLMGRVKLPTASRSKRLGTGQTDYALGAEVSFTKGRIHPFAEVQYRINGDPPDRDYSNSWATSVGAGSRLGKSFVSLSYDYSGSRIPGQPGAHSLGASLSRPLSRKVGIGLFGDVGLSERASDFSIGSTLTYRAF